MKKRGIYFSKYQKIAINNRNNKTLADQIIMAEGGFTLNDIAKLDFDSLGEFKSSIESSYNADQNTVLLKSFKPKEDLHVSKEDADIYSRVMKKLFGEMANIDYGTKKKNSGSSLIKSAINLDKKLTYERSNIRNASASRKTITEAYNNLLRSKKAIFYDTEVFAGKDSAGKNSFDKLTDFSFKIAGNDGIIGDEFEFTNVIGVTSDKEFNYYKEIIDNAMKNGPRNEKERITLERLQSMSKMENFKRLGNGHWIATGIDDVNQDILDFNRINSGLNNLRTIGLEQKKNIGPDGLMLYETQLAKAIGKMNSGDIPVVDQNGTRADFPWLNQAIDDIIKNKDEDGRNKLYAMMGYNSELGGDYINVKPSMHLDLLSLLREYDNVSGIYDTKEKQNIIKGQSPLSLDPLSQAISGTSNKGFEHTASYDVNNTIKLAYSKPVNDAIMSIKKNSKNNAITPGQIFLASGNASNSIGFSLDEHRGLYKTESGVTISNNGIGKEFAGSKITKNESYVINNIGKVNLTKEASDNVKKIYPQLNKSIYTLSMSNIYIENDKPVTGDPLYLFFNSQEELEGYLSKMNHIGDLENGDIVTTIKNKKVKANLNELKEAAADIYPEAFPEEYMRISRNMAYKDKATRDLRGDYSYSKFKRFDSMISKYGNKKEAKDKISLALSKKVAFGQPIAQEYAELQELLGFGDEVKSLMPNTLNNINNCFDMYYSNYTLSKNIDKVITKEDDKGNYNLFQYLRQNILNKAEYQYVNTLPEAEKYSQIDIDSAKRYYEVNLKNSKRFKTNQKNRTNLNLDFDEDDIFRINLDSNGKYTLLQNLVEKYSPVKKFATKDEFYNHAMPIVMNFAEDINNENIDVNYMKENFSHPLLASEYIVNQLKEEKKSNPLNGIIKPIVDYEKVLEIAANISNDDEYVNKIASMAPSFVAKDKTINKIHSKEIKKMVMPDKNDINNYIIEKGFDKSNSEIVNAINNMNNDVYNNIIDNLLNTSGIDIAYDLKKKIIMASDSSGASIDIDLPQIRKTSAGYVLSVGNMDVINGLAISTKNLQRERFKGGVRENIKMTTTLGKAYADIGDYTSYVKTAINNGESPLKGVEKYINNLRKEINKKSSINNKDIIDSTSFQRMDASDLIKALPKIIESGYFKDKDLSIYRDNESDLFKSILKGEKWFNGENPSSDVTSAILDNYAILINEIFAGTKYEKLLKNLTPLDKDSKATTFQLRTGTTIVRGNGQFINMNRPTPFQIRGINYSKDNFEKEIEKLGKAAINGSIIENPFQHSNNSIVNEAGNLFSNTATLKNYTMSTVEFQHEIAKRLRSNKIANKSEEGIKAISLSEGESLMDARIAAGLFNAPNIQKIPSTLELTSTMRYNLETISQVEEIKKMQPRMVIENDMPVFRYPNGRYVKKGSSLVKYKQYGGSSNVIGAKFDGILGYGLFDESGTLVSEQDINKVIRGMSLEDANNFIKDKYTNGLYVSKIDFDGFKKFSAGAEEKTMVGTVFAGAGSKNPLISQALIASGHEDLIGVPIRPENYKYIINKNKVIGTGKIFKTEKEMTEAIQAELFSTSDEIFGKHGILGSLGSNAKIITNLETKKHGSKMTTIEGMLNNMALHNMANGMSREDAVKKVYNELQSGDNPFFNFGEDIKLNGDHIEINTETAELKSNFNINKLFDIYGSYGLNKNEGTVTLTEVQDYNLLSSYSTNNAEITKIDNYIDGLKQEMDDLNTSIADKSIYDYMSEDQIHDYKESLKNDLYDAKQYKKQVSKAIENSSKAKSMDERTAIILMQHKYDQNYVDAAILANQNGALDDGTFNKFFKPLIDKDNKLLPEYNGKPVLSEIKNEIKTKSAFDLNDTRITDEVIEDQVLLNKNGHYINFLKENANNVSKERADLSYSFLGVKDAMNYNADNLTLEDMQDRGFKEFDLDKIITTKAYGTNGSVYGEDLYNGHHILNYKDINGENKSIAVPMMPTKIIGEDDYIGNKVYNSTSIMQNRYKSYLESINGPQKDRESAYALFQESIENYNNTLQEATGKNGIPKDMKRITLRDGIYGKTSRLNIFDRKRISDISKNIGISDYEITSNEIVNNAIINGKTLKEAYDSGMYYDVVGASKEAIKQMGYLDENYMKSVGVSNEKDMLDLLKTNGNIVTANRDPDIHEGSISPAMLFYDPSLDGSGKERIRISSELHKKQFGDVDGDTGTISSYTIDNIDYLQAKKLGKEADFDNVNREMIINAANINRVWHEKVTNDLIDEMYLDSKSGIGPIYSGINAEQIFKSSTIEGKFFASFNRTPDAKEAADNDRVLQDFKDYVSKKDNNIELDFENFNSSSSNKMEVFENIDKALDLVDNETDRERFKTAVIFKEKYTRQRMDTLSISRKAAIGESDLPAFDIRILNQLFENNNDKIRESQYINSSIVQEVISSKHGRLVDYYTKSQEYASSMNDMIFGDNDKIRKNGEVNFKKWFLENIADKDQESIALKIANAKNEEILTEKGAANAINKYNKEYLADSIIELSSFYSKQDEIDTIRRVMKIGRTTNGVDVDTLNDFFENIPSDTLSVTGNTLKNIIDKNIGINNYENIKRKKALLEEEAVQDSTRILADSTEWTKKDSNFKEYFKAGVNALGDAMSDIGGKKLALGALGVAGGIMALGLIGGNPSVPADTQAQEQYRNNEEMQSLYDKELAMQQSHSKTGYVVNINANSDKPSNYNNKAVQASVYNSYRGNANITMNTTSDLNNISDRDIEKMIEGAL